MQLLSEFYAASFPLTCTSCVPSCAFLFFSLSLWGLFVHSILLYAHALPSLLSLLAISHFPFPLSFFLSFCQLVAFAIPVLHIADAGFVFILHERQIYRNKRHTHRLSVPILLDSRKLCNVTIGRLPYFRATNLLDLHVRWRLACVACENAHNVSGTWGAIWHAGSGNDNILRAIDEFPMLAKLDSFFENSLSVVLRI